MENLEDAETLQFPVSISGVLKKFNLREDGTEWTNEEINDGLADDYLTETLTIEDGVVTKREVH